MRPEAIRARQLAYRANYIVLAYAEHPDLAEHTGYWIHGVQAPVLKPSAKLRVWKESEDRFAMVKFESRAQGLIVMFESIGDKMQFQRDFIPERVDLQV
jgi:predicted oxidoreductase